MTLASINNQQSGQTSQATNVKVIFSVASGGGLLTSPKKDIAGLTESGLRNVLCEKRSERRIRIVRLCVCLPKTANNFTLMTLVWKRTALLHPALTYIWRNIASV